VVELPLVRALRALHLEAPVTMLDYTEVSRLFYANLRGSAVAPQAKDRGFGEFIRRCGVNVIILEPLLKEDSRYRDDPEFKEFLAGTRPDGFTRFDVPGRPRFWATQIAVRDDLLPPAARRPKR
jgi:hypothetical protein